MAHQISYYCEVCLKIHMVEIVGCLKDSSQERVYLPQIQQASELKKGQSLETNYKKQVKEPVQEDDVEG